MRSGAGFDAEWLAARRPYDEAALDRAAVGEIQRWGARLGPTCRPTVVDLGSGTGAALGRVRRWLAPRAIVAYAVDHDATLLPSAGTSSPNLPIVADLLEPLDAHGGPCDGSVDLVVGHALADLVPLDRLAARAAALVRPGGLVHLALAYDGLTAFSPPLEPGLERDVVAAFHRHMDRPASDAVTRGGSSAGRCLAPALTAAGLEIVTDAPSVWQVRAGDGKAGRSVLDRLIRFVVDAARAVGGVSAPDLRRWEAARRAALASGSLEARVGHRDVLGRAPLASEP